MWPWQQSSPVKQRGKGEFSVLHPWMIPANPWWKVGKIERYWMDAGKKVYRSHSSIFKVSQQSLSKKKKIGCSLESVKKVHPKYIPELLAATDGNGDQWNFLNFFQSLRMGDMGDAKQIPNTSLGMSLRKSNLIPTFHSHEIQPSKWPQTTTFTKLPNLQIGNKACFADFQLQSFSTDLGTFHLHLDGCSKGCLQFLEPKKPCRQTTSTCRTRGVQYLE